MGNISIYKKIKNIIASKGELPDNFTPEEKQVDDNKLRFAPGAMEGILNNHSAGQGGSSIFPKTLKGYMTKSEAAALKHFEENEADNFNTASDGKIVLSYISMHKQEFPGNKLFSVAYYFAANGTKMESVKLGLMIMRIFNLPPSERAKIKDVLVTLGYCEDFTGYVLDNTFSWDNESRQKLVFEYAQKLKGWGKINIMNILEADTPEIKHWILCHGCKNTVMYNYLAMTCAAKSNIYERFAEGNLSEEELAGAKDIIGGLVEDGPAASLADLKNPSGLIVAFFLQLKDRALDVETIDLLYGIKQYFNTRELEQADTIGKMVEELVSAVDVEELIKDNLVDKTFLCLRIASARDLDLSDDLYELLRNDFDKYFKHSSYILMKGNKVDEFFDLCDLNIDEKVYPVGMGESLGLKLDSEKALPLDIIVQYLEKFPLKGKKMVKICINSPIVRWRNMAAKTLIGWVDELGKKLPDIDEEIYDMVVAVHSNECNENTRKMWNKLL